MQFYTDDMLIYNVFFRKVLPTILVMLNFLSIEAQTATAITTIYGDGHESGTSGDTSDTFFTSSTGSVKRYNDSNNLLGFISDGVTYSTGVSDAKLTDNGISFISTNFEAFPIPADIILAADNTTNQSLIGIGYNWDGVNQTNASTDYINTNFSPIVPSFFLRDGTSGLELSTNFFNIRRQDVEYNAVIINPAVSINDDVPDVIVTQTGSPGGSDRFRFIDSNGNLVGNEVIVSFGSVTRVGITDWTIYRVNRSGVVTSLFGANTPRDLRMISFKLSDFGITVNNFDQIEKFRHTFSGSTDIAFTAYNNGAVAINLPDAELGVSDSSIAADDFCAPTTATFVSTITNNSMDDAIDFIVDFDLPEGITFTTSSSVFSSGSGSASYNVENRKWNISGLAAGENVQLTANSTASGTTFPLSFTVTAELEYQTDSDTSNDSQLIIALGDDFDCDGVDDINDDDDDNDGILDVDEGTGDLDNDGIPNNLDLDSDGDQCPDALEGVGTVDLTDLDDNFAIPGTLGAGMVNSNGITTLAAAGSGSGQGIGDSQLSGTQSCDITDTDSDGFIDILDLDDDNDGILDTVEGTVNSLILDSDSDGCPDAIEGGGTFTFSNLDVNERLAGGVDENGIPTLATSSGQTVGDSQNTGIQSSNCSLLPVIISQIYQTSSDNAIELTNIGANTVSNINLVLFKNIGATDPTGVTPDATLTIASLDAGKSVVIKSVATLSGVTLTNSPDEVENASITDIDGGDDIIILSTTTNNTAWANRYDVVDEIEDETSLVRIDETTTSNTTYTSSEWINFIDDAIEVFGDTDPIPAITRHVNAPLVSDVKNGTLLSNSSLGYHVINPTIRLSNVWSNGNPDKSRSVIIQENYNHSGSNLNARKLDVQDTNVLTITDNAIIVVNGVNINFGAEIRVLGTTGQFIQVHDGGTQVTSAGKLSISQKSELPNTFRYNYWSSPVVESVGGTIYRVGDILKDAGGDLTATSTLTDINFISSLDGSTGSPINISNYWIYGYFNEDTTDDWFQFRETSFINHGLGFTMKSTGAPSQYFTFSGIPNDGDIDFNIDGETTSLFGNPYPGTLDGRAFILENKGAIDGALYFWEHTGESEANGHVESGYTGGYAQLTLSMATAAITPVAGISGLGEATKVPTRYIARGQGFFVASDTDGGSITFNNKQRSYNAGVNAPIFFKTSKIKEDDLSILKLGLIYNSENNISLHRQIGISFNEKHSYEFDYGYEAEMLDANSTDVYWEFNEMDNKKLVIAGVEEISDELIIPLTIAVGTDEPVALKIDSKENIKEDIFLYDALETTYKTIESNELLSLPLSEGIYKNRFYVTFNESAKVLNSNEVTLNSDLQVYLNNKEDKIVITKSSNLQVYSIKLFNIFGQEIQVSPEENQINITEINTTELPVAIYFVKIDTNKGIISKKVLRN